MRYEITATGEARTHAIKADTIESAATKGAAKFFRSFKPFQVATIKAITKSSWAIELVDKLGEVKKVYVSAAETGTADNGQSELRHAIS